jgi:hypothetical protein
LEYVIQGCADIVIKNYKTQLPILYLPEAFLSNVHSEGEYKTSVGGKQGMNLLGWNTENNSTFIIQTPVVTMQILEMTAGGSRTTQNRAVNTMERIEGMGSNIITLSHSPIDIPSIQVFRLSQSGHTIATSLEIDSLDENELTLTTSENDWILVLYSFNGEVDEINIGKFQNGGYCIIEGITNIYNENTGVSEPLYFKFPKVDITPSFNIKMLNSKNPDYLFHIYCNALKEGDTLLTVFKAEEI